MAKTKRKLPPGNKVEGRLWIKKDDNSFLGHGRVELLALIEETGSISAAARAMSMSYKAAWDAVDAMNNLADRPLVERSAGGKCGGGTRLTEEGKKPWPCSERWRPSIVTFCPALARASATCPGFTN